MFSSNLIRDFNIYSTQPWHLPGGLFQSQSEEKYMFFFTRRHPINACSQKFNRTTGYGLWHCSSKDKNVKHGSQVIGYRLQFAFKKIDREKQKIHTNWIMHEFRLKKTTNVDSLVLCKIFERKNGEEGDTDGIGAGIALSDVADGEEEKEGRLAKRRGIVAESGRQKDFMADFAETSSKKASSSLSSSSLPYEAPWVVEELIQHQEETATDERLEKRRQVEKPIQQQAIIIDNNDKRYCRVDNIEATGQPSVCNDDFSSREVLIYLDDFPPCNAGSNASSLIGDCTETSILPYEEQAATEEGLEMRKLVEEPDQQQGILAGKNEETIEANSQSLLFNAVREFLFVDDSSPQAEINASSSFFPLLKWHSESGVN